MSRWTRSASSGGHSERHEGGTWVAWSHETGAVLGISLAILTVPCAILGSSLAILKAP